MNPGKVSHSCWQPTTYEGIGYVVSQRRTQEEM